MRILTLGIAVALGLSTGCGTVDQPGNDGGDNPSKLSITVVGYGGGLPDVPIVFHNEDGTVQSEATTDAEGSASIDEAAAVTVVDLDENNDVAGLYTWFSPGKSELYLNLSRGTPNTTTIDISAPPQNGANSYRYRSNCGQQFPQAPMVTETITSQCLGPSGKLSIHFLAEDDGGDIGGTSATAIEPSGSITLPAFEPPNTLTVSLDGLTAGGTNSIAAGVTLGGSDFLLNTRSNQTELEQAVAKNLDGGVYGTYTFVDGTDVSTVTLRNAAGTAELSILKDDLLDAPTLSATSSGVMWSTNESYDGALVTQTTSDDIVWTFWVAGSENKFVVRPSLPAAYAGAVNSATYKASSVTIVQRSDTDSGTDFVANKPFPTDSETKVQTATKTLSQ